MKSGADHEQKCTIIGLKDENFAHLKGINCSPDHVGQYEMALGLAIKSSIKDLRDDQIASRVEDFIHGLKPVKAKS